MRRIQAVIKPFKLDDVRDALSGIGVAGLTASEAKGFGRQRGHTEHYRGAEYRVDFQPKVTVDLVVPDDRVDEAVQAILQSAATGKMGDGKVFVSPVEDAVRIRTGERAEGAL